MVQMVPAMEESAYNPTSAEPCNITAAAAVAEVKQAKILSRAMVALGEAVTELLVPGSQSQAQVRQTREVAVAVPQTVSM
jgi:hypothetical protein